MCSFSIGQERTRWLRKLSGLASLGAWQKISHLKTEAGLGRLLAMLQGSREILRGAARNWMEGVVGRCMHLEGAHGVRDFIFWYFCFCFLSIFFILGLCNAEAADMSTMSLIHLTTFIIPVLLYYFFVPLVSHVLQHIFQHIFQHILQHILGTSLSYV